MTSTAKREIDAPDTFPALNLTHPTANGTTAFNGAAWDWTPPPRDWAKLGTYCDDFTPCEGWYFSCSDDLGGVGGGPGAYCSSDDDCMATCHEEYGGLCGSVVFEAMEAQGDPVYFDDARTVTTEAAWWWTRETDVPDAAKSDGQGFAKTPTDAPAPTQPVVRRRYMKRT